MTLLSPNVGGHITFERVTNRHPKKVTKNCQVYDLSNYEQNTYILPQFMVNWENFRLFFWMGIPTKDEQAEKVQFFLLFQGFHKKQFFFALCAAFLFPLGSWLTEPENGFMEPKYFAFRR